MLHACGIQTADRSQHYVVLEYYSCTTHHLQLRRSALKRNGVEANRRATHVLAQLFVFRTVDKVFRPRLVEFELQIVQRFKIQITELTGELSQCLWHLSDELKVPDVGCCTRGRALPVQICIQNNGFDHLFHERDIDARQHIHDAELCKTPFRIPNPNCPTHPIG